MKIPIVNKKDQVQKYIKVEERNFETDIYRVSALLIKNSKNEILIQKRSKNKKQNPNKWSVSVAGTVEKSESYESNIIKEAEEEIGLNLKITPPKKLFKNNTLRDKYKHFTQFYSITLDKPISSFKLQIEEVAEIQWLSPKKVSNLPDNQCDEILNSIKKNLQSILF